MEALIHHFKALYGRAACSGPARSMPRWKRPRASSASIWCRTAGNRAYRCKIRDAKLRAYAGDWIHGKGIMLGPMSPPILGLNDIVFGESIEERCGNP